MSKLTICINCKHLMHTDAANIWYNYRCTSDIFRSSKVINYVTGEEEYKNNNYTDGHPHPININLHGDCKGYEEK